MVTLYASNDSEDPNCRGWPSRGEGTTGKTLREWLGIKDLME
jgi:hypothetical protein